jgi:hypothetical protein
VPPVLVLPVVPPAEEDDDFVVTPPAPPVDPVEAPPLPALALAVELELGALPPAPPLDEEDVPPEPAFPLCPPELDWPPDPELLPEPPEPLHARAKVRLKVAIRRGSLQAMYFIVPAILSRRLSPDKRQPSDRESTRSEYLPLVLLRAHRVPKCAWSPGRAQSSRATRNCDCALPHQG